MLCRHRRVPRALAWLGLISYSVYLLHPVLIEVYNNVPWTRNQNFVPMELFLVAVFVTVLLACCGLTHRYIEEPMQGLGRRVARRLDDRFGPDTLGARRAWPGPSAAPAVQAHGVTARAAGGAPHADGHAGQADRLAARR